MDLVRRAAVAVVVVMASGVMVGVALPRRFSVERSVVIEGPPARIHPYLASLRRWPEWSPWTKERDPQARFSLAGPEEGVGASRSWIGPVVGRGQVAIVEADPRTGVTLEEQVESETPNAVGRIRYAPEGTSTRVTWTDQGTLPAAAGGFFRGRVERSLGLDMERGLAKLKAQVEALPKPPPEPEPLPEASDAGTEPDAGR